MSGRFVNRQRQLVLKGGRSSDLASELEHQMLLTEFKFLLCYAA